MSWPKTVQNGKESFRGNSIRIGFVPLCDCAPLVMAQELGLFEAEGLRVELSREVGWATVRDKLVMRDLEAAHAPAAMVLAINLGIGSFRMPCVTGLVLNLHGNAITLSNRLWEVGVRDATTLGDYLRAQGKDKPITFGVAFSCSSHASLLQKWLRSGRVDSARDINVVVVPPPQMAANLKSGNLDGYCVGEPWNSLALVQRAGWIVATSPTIEPGHPEKVLLVRSDFAEARADEHPSIIRALRASCEFCQSPANRDRIARTLALPKYLNTSQEAISRSLCGPFRFDKERTEPASDLHIFSGPDVNEPGPEKAAWVRDSLILTGVLPRTNELDQRRLASMFRQDIFHAAVESARTARVVTA